MEKMKCTGTRRIPSDEEFIRWSTEAAAMVDKYGWHDRTVMPWSWVEKITKIIDDVANGLTDIMNHREQTELNGVTIKNLKTGKTFKVDKDMVDLFTESEYHVVIE